MKARFDSRRLCRTGAFVLFVAAPLVGGYASIAGAAGNANGSSQANSGSSQANSGGSQANSGGGGSGNSNHSGANGETFAPPPAGDNTVNAHDLGTEGCDPHSNGNADQSNTASVATTTTARAPNGAAAVQSQRRTRGLAVMARQEAVR